MGVRILVLGWVLALMCGAVSFADRIGGLPKLVYDVKLGMFRIGKAWIEDLGMTQLEGEDRPLWHIRVRVITPQLKDTEEIFADPKTLIPIRIRREVKYMGRDERIEEIYYPDKGQVRVIKEGDGEQVLTGKGPLDNVFLVILKSFFQGVDAIKEVNLPTGSYEVLVREGGKMRTYAGVFDTWEVFTRPAKIRLWVSRDKRLPVRVAGAIPILPYTLVIRKIEYPQEVDS